MKKLTFVAALLLLIQGAFAGGILTNTNQSAQFIRMMSRNASVDIDAVYFNPAGLIKLEDGWHFAFYSQTIFQDRNIESQFPFLNDGKYKGTTQVPVFPTAFAVYKKENWAFSLGFGPNAGGGSAEYKRGIPTFEIPISKLVPGLAGLSQINSDLNVTGYSANLYLKGSSVFWGIQVGATYKVNDIFSVYGGVRYLPSKNTYKGHISDIKLQVAGQMVGAPSWLTGTAGIISGYANQASAGATLMLNTAGSLQPIIDNGAGSYTLAQLEAGSIITPTQRAQIEGGLLTMGLTQAQIDAMNLNTIQGSFSSAGNELTATAQQLSGTAVTLQQTSSQLSDKEVNTEQTGAGITPMVGINISPNDDWNIAVKYEHKTKLTLKNKPKADDNYSAQIFGENVSSDIPGILGIGVGYKGLDWLEAQLSYDLYFNKGVEWGTNTRDGVIWGTMVENGLADPSKIRTREINNNGYEIGLGLQFNLSDNFAFSVGGLYGDMGVAPSYQSDFSYSNPSFTPGAGIMWKITDQLTLDAGVSNTFYQDQTVTFEDPDVPSYKDIYGKTALSFAIGLSYSIF